MDNKAFFDLLESIISGGVLKKAVFSKPLDKQIPRADARLVMLKSGLHVQITCFSADGKARSRNLSAADAASAASEVMELFTRSFGQINVLTKSGECQAASKKGEIKIVFNRIDAEKTDSAEIESHDAKKAYILPEKPLLFLRELGMADEKGRIFDRSRAKFRQINRFLEYLRDAVDAIGHDGTLCVYDLCCGKGYLTFAAYYYLKEIRGIDAVVYGADLKADVIENCRNIAEKCGFDGLCFVCRDIEEIKPDRKVDIVMALHACDTATDVALARAVVWNAKAVLSAPCCQHELAGQINPAADEILLKQNLLRYRFAQLLTDALRARIMEICGYSVSAAEFVDPDETDKNLLIRAVKRKRTHSQAQSLAMKEALISECSRYGVSPYLAVLLRDRLA